MRFFKNEEGFTLVELMVVVAIIGILSAVAIPNFKKYQAKSKTSEAKLQLASIYSAETAFQADSDSFSSCLGQMGYDPGQANSRYYTVGFSAAGGPTNPNGVTCAPGTDYHYVSGKIVAGHTPAIGDLPSGNPTYDNSKTRSTVETSGTWFVAGAGGQVSTDTSASVDTWTVDENKQFEHAVTGY